MDQEIKENKIYSFKNHFWKRLLALFLALLMLGGTLLAYRAQIRTTGLEYAGTLLEQAYAVTNSNSAYLSKSFLERAWEVLTNAVFKPRSYQEFETYASICIAKGEYADAAEYMQGCIEKYPGDSDSELGLLYLRKGSLYTLTEQDEPAMECYNQALALDDTLSDAYLLRAQIFSTNGDNPSAAADLEKYQSISGPNPVISAALGGLYESMEDYSSAIPAYTQAIDSGEYETESLASRARCLILTEDTKSAMGDLERYFEEKGSDPTGEYHAMLGMCYMEYERFTEAIETFHSAADLGYADSYMLYQQCVACGYITKDYETVVTDGKKAIELAEKAGGKESEIAELYQWIGLSYFIQNDLENAGPAFENVLKYSPEMEYINYYAGICLMSGGETEKALKYLERSAELGEYVSICSYNAALCHIQLEEYETAEKLLEAAIEANDDEEAVLESKEMLAQLEAFLESSEEEQTTG
ncbi:MAG: tetratricopeptide repeat protein [Eubacteriales bacterium]|nr:tetratricopeptide repeat protein [Eubacteriales bacterium]